jgi:hypothetical protein
LLGATSAEWKSIECGMVTCIDFMPPLVSVTCTLSPWSTTIGADAPVPE